MNRLLCGWAVGAGATAALLASASAAQANLLSFDLSTHSSEVGIGPELLSANITFSIDNGLGELTITVTNNTSAPDAYDINQIYFNSNDVPLAANTLPPSWSLLTSQQADGFGTFDYLLRTNAGPQQIDPGQSKQYILDITGTAEKLDFSELSEPFDSNILSVVAMKFVNGPGDASAFGAFVPSPGVIALLGIAGALGNRRRRRRMT